MVNLADYINSLVHLSYTKYKYTINSSKLFIVAISRDFIIKSDLWWNMHVNHVTTTKQPDHSPHCKEILHYMHVFSVYAIRETFCSYIRKFKVWILSHLQCHVPHNQGIFYQAIQVTYKTTTQLFSHLQWILYIMLLIAIILMAVLLNTLLIAPNWKLWKSTNV